MNLRINGVFVNNNYCLINNKQQYKQRSNSTVFCGTRTMKALSYSMIAAAMLPLTSCNNKKNLKPSEEVVKVISTSEKTDSSYATMGEYYYKDNHILRLYHYFPTDNEINADNYNWSEAIYPDGRVEKDSMGYRISITPEGEKTVVHTETDTDGNKKVTTTYPDLTKKIRIDYKTNGPEESLYSETQYRANGSKETEKIFHEFYVNDTLNKSEKKIEQSIKRYNDKDILLLWDSNITDTLRSEANNKYDKKGRLIYKDLTQESFEYKKNSKIPYRSISVCEDCKRIKLYNSQGIVKKDFFKASDGTITEVNDSIM